MKRALIVVVVFLIAFVVARRTALIANRTSKTQTTIEPINAQTVVTSLPPLTNLSFRAQRPAAPKPNSAPSPQSETVESTASLPSEQTTEQLPSTQTASAASALATNPDRRDPMARIALSMVGIDPTAEEYWASAINDSTLSDKEREDLIEDLNEVGFTDPQNPTAADIPLILSRLQIIEAYAPSAMDETNARSFAEAYKDLSNMLSRLTAQ